MLTAAALVCAVSVPWQDGNQRGTAVLPGHDNNRSLAKATRRCFSVNVKIDTPRNAHRSGEGSVRLTREVAVVGKPSRSTQRKLSDAWTVWASTDIFSV